MKTLIAMCQDMVPSTEFEARVVAYVRDTLGVTSDQTLWYFNGGGAGSEISSIFGTAQMEEADQVVLVGHIGCTFESQVLPNVMTNVRIFRQNFPGKQVVGLLMIEDDVKIVEVPYL